MPGKRQPLILALVMGVFLFACADAFAVDKYHNRQRKRSFYSEEAKAERERTVTWQTVCFERYLHRENIETKEKTLIVDDYGQPTMCGDYERVIGDPVTERVHPQFDPDKEDGNSIFYFQNDRLKKGTRE